MMNTHFLFGLGNPGREYQYTRHNVGFDVADFVVRQQNGHWQSSPKLHAEVAKVDRLIVAKPQTFMNNSGQAVRAVIDYYDKQHLGEIFVAHDDLDIGLGTFKVQFGTGPKIHNGLSSIYQHLGTHDFWHIRIGVDGRKGDRSMPGHAYVLSQFSDDERVILNKVIEQAVQVALRQLQYS